MAKLNGKDILFSPKLVVVESGGGDYDQGYNEGYVEGEEQGYNDGYIDGYDFGEDSGTHDGFEVGVGLGDDVKEVAVFTAYKSPDIDGTYPIALDNPKQLVVTTTGSCNFSTIEITDANGTTHGLTADGTIRLEAETYTLDFPDEFVCNADDGYGEIYLEGSYDGIVGVSVTNKMSYAEGVEVGKQAEHDAFWDMFQDNGNRRNYDYTFQYWSTEYIKPKYPIISTSIYQTFYFCTKLKELPIVSYEGNGFNNLCLAFRNCEALEEIPFDIVVDSTDIGAMNQTFCNCYNLKTIKKLVLNETAYAWGYTFLECTALENITIEGVLNCASNIDMGDTKLTHDSLMSIINHLKDFSGTTTTKSITFGATNLAKLTDAEKAIATQKGWTLL